MGSLSPLASQNFVEYKDGLTFDRLSVQLTKRSPENFRPSSGPAHPVLLLAFDWGRFEHVGTVKAECGN